VANGRSNFGFNVTGGGGGLANLVQAPKVAPARTLQFAPTPRPRIERDEKDPKKQILAALLGSAAPFAADAALEGLGSLTGLEFFEQDPLAQKAERSLTAPEDATPVIGGLTEEELKQRLREERIREIQKALPRLPAERKTALGNIASSFLQFAPALALTGDEDDGSASAFISAVNAARKVDAATERAELEAAIKRSQSRAVELAKVDPKLTQKTVNTFYQPDPKRDLFVNYQTNALQDENGVTWIRSNGIENFDMDQSGNFVEKGRYYRNPKASILDGQSAEVQTKPFQDTETGLLLQGRIEKISTPEGQETLQITFQDPLNLDERITLEELNKRGPNNFTSNIEGFELRPFPSSKKNPLQIEFEEDATKIANLNALGLAAQAVLDPLMENVKMVRGEDGVLRPTNFNNGITSAVPQKLAGVVDSIQRNVMNFGDTLNQLGITDAKGISAVDSYNLGRLKQDDSALNAAALIAANSKFEAIYADGNSTDADKRAASAELSRIIMRLSTTAKEQDSLLEGMFGGQNFLVKNQQDLQDYLNKQGLFAANQIRLAYMAAAAQGEKGRSLSDKDIAFFMATLGFDSGNAEVVSRNVGQFVFQKVLQFDQEKERGSTAREIAALDQKSEEERELYLRGLNSKRAGKLGVDVGSLENLRKETDPEKRQQLLFKVQDRINKNTAGNLQTHFVFNPKYGVFVPVTLASKFQNDYLLERLNKYLGQLGYDYRTGTDRMYAPTAPSPVGRKDQDKDKTRNLEVRGDL
jgi:hypothetical protein